MHKQTNNILVALNQTEHNKSRKKNFKIKITKNEKTKLKFKMLHEYCLVEITNNPRQRRQKLND